MHATAEEVPTSTAAVKRMAGALGRAAGPHAAMRTLSYALCAVAERVKGARGGLRRMQDRT